MATINRIEDALAAAGAPKPKRRGVTLVNHGAVEGVVEYLTFSYPNRDVTWRVEPIDFVTGAKITALQLDLLEVQQEASAQRDREGTDVPALRRVQEKYDDLIARAVAVAGPLMIPTGKRKWRRRRARRLGINPLRNATHVDVTAVIGFLARCLMNSPNRVSQAAALN